VLTGCSIAGRSTMPPVGCPRGSTAAGYGAGAELRDMTQMAQLSTL
jgi:hypothetical protein